MMNTTYAVDIHLNSNENRLRINDVARSKALCAEIFIKIIFTKRLSRIKLFYFIFPFFLVIYLYLIEILR